jgi:hypothetical protein
VPDEDFPAKPGNAAPDDAQSELWGSAKPEAVFDTPTQDNAAPAPPLARGGAEADLAQELQLGSEIEAELTQERDDRVSPLILSAAVIGMLIGLFVWGSLAMSVMSSADSIFDESSTGAQGQPAAEGEIDCDDFDTRAALTPAQAEAYVEQCGGTDSVAESGTPPNDGVSNREDCDAIRGTDYRSPEERTWFLANCVEG